MTYDIRTLDHYIWHAHGFFLLTTLSAGQVCLARFKIVSYVDHSGSGGKDELFFLNSQIDLAGPEIALKPDASQSHSGQSVQERQFSQQFCWHSSIGWTVRPFIRKLKQVLILCRAEAETNDSNIRSLLISVSESDVIPEHVVLCFYVLQTVNTNTQLQ